MSYRPIKNQPVSVYYGCGSVAFVYCTGAQEWHNVSLLGDVTSPTTVAHYVSMTCTEYREALTARGQHTAYTNKRLQCKDEVHSSPLNK